MTLGDLAELVRRDDVERAAIADRVRLWTADGLIATESGVSVGTGTPRRYGEAALFKAAVLNGLADFGMPVRKGQFAPFWSALDHKLDVAIAIWSAGEGIPLVLEIADFGKTDRFGRRFFAFLHQGRQKMEHIGDLIHPKAESAHVINLGRLFKRIDDRRAALAKAE